MSRRLYVTATNVSQWHAVDTKSTLQHWCYMLLILSLYPAATLQCNCVDGKCLTDNSCQPGYQCKEKFFGYFCEYNNIVRFDKDTIPQLSDDNINTCAPISNDFVTSYARTKIYMIRLIVKDSSNFRNLSFVFKDWSRERVCNGHLVAAEKTVLEYYCGTLDLSNGFTVRGLGGNEICHILLTEGRNMILGGLIMTNASSLDDSLYNKNGLMDGNRRNDSGSCFRTQSSTEEFRIEIYLKFGALVNFVEIFDDNHPTPAISGTTVESMNVENKTTNSFFLTHVKPFRVYYNILGNPVWRINLVKKGQFGSCEIEVRGDCANGKYGSDCSSICRSRCKDSRCTSQGVCISCKEGLTGRSCCKPFCAIDKACGPDGNCINGCVNRKYGADCSKDCSPNCAGDGTCDIWSMCKFNCKVGFYSWNCSLACSRYCAGNKGCFQHGTCVSGCLAKYFGNDCSKQCSPNCAGDGSCDLQGKCTYGCKVGFYSPNCSLVVCSRHCAGDGSCDPQGRCKFKCKPGFYSPLCSLACSPNCAYDGSCYSNMSCVYGCRHKYFGNTCSQVCSPNCGMDGGCDRKGSCIHGCRAAFFGSRCLNKCSSKCANDGSCDINGFCSKGCKPGYFNHNCTQKCSPNCAKDGSCDNNASCTDGCEPGYFTDACSERCSPYCAEDRSCDDEGVCNHGCAFGYFGPQCYYLGLSSQMTGQESKTCHCYGDKCKDPSDQCEDLKNCIKGWFGYNCAYKDLAVHATMIDPSLNDNDKDTCLSGESFIVSAEWEPAIWFSFLWLSFREYVANVNGFVIVTEFGNETHILMESYIRTRVLEGHTLEIACQTRVPLSKLSIFWTGKGSVCSMSVSGDQNRALALAMMPEVAQDQDVREKIINLTDGDIGVKRCVNAKNFSVISFPFQHSVSLSRIALYPDTKIEGAAVINVTIKSISNTTSSEVSIDHNTRPFLLLLAEENVISLDLELTSGELDICEVEVFGDCTPPFYGFSCTESCPETCLRQQCNYAGQCLESPEERSEPYFQEEDKSAGNSSNYLNAILGSATSLPSLTFVNTIAIGLVHTIISSQ